MRVRPSQISLVIFAVSLGWIAGQLGSIRHDERVRERTLLEVTADDFEYDLDQRRDPFSFNEVSETRVDTNGDGAYNYWMTVMRAGTRHESTYTAEDENFDGEVDVSTLSTSDLRMVYSLRKYDGNRTPNYQMFRLSDVRSDVAGAAFSYFDINLDGRIDVMEVLGSDPERRIIFIETWYSTSAWDEGDWFEGFTIELAPSTLIHVTFDWKTGFWKENVG